MAEVLPLSRRTFAAALLLAGAVLVAREAATLALPSPVAFSGLPTADSVVVDKSERRLHLLRDGVPFRSYPVAFGANPKGHKEREGDQRTPEGRYLLDWRNSNSRFYKSIHVSYPNARDIAFANAMGMDSGGMIMVHGLPNWNLGGWADFFFENRNWTNGCIAVKNHQMDEIWQAVRPNTPIEIVP